MRGVHGHGMISASRRVEAPSLHSNDSCPSHDDVGGFFFEAEAVRTASSDRDAPRRLLLFMRFEDPRKPISIYFNVPGALMKPCLAVYDTLRTLECPVTTVNLGLATGMGAFLCGAGTKGMRYALPNARFLMQRTGLDDPYQGQASDIGLMVRENLRDNDRMARTQRLYASRRWRLRDFV